MLTVPPARPDPASRARFAAASVEAIFGGRSLGLPGTRLAAVAFPHPVGLRGHWHYWWQAHYMDCLIDQYERLAESDPGEAAVALRRASRLARGIWVRNGLHWTNSYYDDMAWLALALQRLEAASTAAGRRWRGTGITPLENALRSAHTAELGGGVFWNTTRDYKNTATTAPAALYFARSGEQERATDLMTWLRENLRDGATGLYFDGVRADPDTPASGTIVHAIHTYNQGTVLGALVTLGGREHLAEAAGLIHAVKAHLADSAGVLRMTAGGDAGLFTGILARYLALAAHTPGLAGDAVRAAVELLDATSDALWRRRSPGSARNSSVFPPGSNGQGSKPVSLSTQLQAWMIFEAAARVQAAGPAHNNDTGM
ncbi:glycoside hydrolase family 76 protein [Arthrobacter sp. Br18]|uniref:glycoside hydrolase family 76 protein n=1 Tax=Arthrobacter sp. Br18 TaxID=1312954 RepID=UPI0004787EBA|nr:glycoside hydrolase family 76 protein [Arthrobacter sp. Br18]